MNCLRTLKCNMIWMILSYAAVGMLLHQFVLVPQRARIAKFRELKDAVEYDYFRLTRSRHLVESVDATVAAARSEVSDLEWTVAADREPGVIFFDHISMLAGRSGMELVEWQKMEVPEKESPYLRWRVRVSGPYRGMLDFLERIEGHARYLRAEEIQFESAGTANSSPVFTFVLSSIRKKGGTK